MENIGFQDVENLLPSQLFQLAEENYTKLNFPDAQYFYTLCIQKDPLNEEAASQYADLLKQTNQIEKAIQFLTQQIQYHRNEGDYRKYLQLADLLDGHESIELLETGIKLILQHPNYNQQSDIKRDLSEAYSGLAEIYQTDFLHLPESEEKVIFCIKKAKEADPTALDSYLQEANYFLNKENEKDAKIALNTVLKGLEKLNEENDHHDDSFKINVCKLCIEVNDFESALPILENMVLSNDANFEAFYLLAFCHFKCNNFCTSLEYMETLLTKKEQFEDDGELYTAAIELKAELDKTDFQKGNDWKDEDENEQGNNDEDWMDME
ncbi:hypothetical protein IMG5_027130 [Ichthyophthirius multifiliis]|uniref:Tetratricopeptide repeat protein n=1 Tax=Ichthyophthirius multifiliis TaxID=5932 RepID=G0QL86_ICHMU|nr:hypothetical protein IMG5_027130 [Ichthyophthirius multifiliis]EGR34015.1 hypothetical protein IMG5_027130 [Ichthyophthirius multifiliis]|eukprot:XP_004039319.1 hypothetical protein IMG5_027130 [Ichthyophthirius multifiliis]